MIGQPDRLSRIKPGPSGKTEKDLVKPEYRVSAPYPPVDADVTPSAWSGPGPLNYAVRGRAAMCPNFPVAPPTSREYPQGIRVRGALMAKLNINGRMLEVEAEADTPLLWVIREQVGLTGTKYGCGVAACGACTVHMDGVAVRSCSVRLGDVNESARIVTIEGLSEASSHPVQKAWAALDVPQCGYCQSGQIMAAAALLAKNPQPADNDIDEAMTNICRCGTYQRIRAAVHMAAGMSRS